jgi:imidazolonepropionase-like amidohydrolase
LQRAQLHVRQAKQAGVKILAGTDTPDSFVYAGSSLHDELALYVQAGLTPLQALQSATIDAARFSGMAADHGSIAVGKHANLILLAANPLEDIAALRQPAGLILAGHWYDKQALTAQHDFALQQAGSIRLNWQLLWSALQSPAFRQQFAD